jgi:Ca2+-binding RTX toxin-like protein
LSVNSLIVNGVPGLGTLPFTVINFVNVIGTSQSDSIIGDSKDNLLIAGNGDDKIFGLNGNDTVRGGAGNDVIGGGSNGRLFTTGIIDGNDVLEGDSGNDILIGGGGNDLLDGGNDVDTADYSNLSNGITLEAVGVVNKGKVGKDQILNIEEIIGAVGKANVIDGSTGTSTTTSFDINLSANSLIVNGIPGLGSVKFAVQNFVNVTGTSQSDSIVGNNTSNLLKGGRGSDKISGLGGDDTIVGVDPGSLQPGIKEIDVLTAGADADKLVIGDEKNPYYLGGGGLIGLNDYGFITDFQTGQDKIQLKNLNNYIFGKKFIAINSLLGTTTESKDFDNSQLEAAVDEIIKNNGILTKTTEESLNSSLIYSRFDIVALIPNSYSLNDIQLV